jgi:ABC-2 type transport system ATP-binding protein
VCLSECKTEAKLEPFAISANSLCKTFHTRSGLWKTKRKAIEAVKDISFTVERGELFGLLGPNGAGKTTTVKMLTTLLLPTSGTAKILNLDVIDQTAEVRKHIGFAFSGSRGLYNRLTAVQNLKYFAELYAMDPSVTRKRIPELLELVGLSGRGDDRVETYSSGMTQRLHLARALLHDPEILFLDEPTVGIDPVGSRELRNTIKDLITLGKTILLTTHYMAEAEELCQRIAIINHGRIIVLDSPDALKRRISGDSVIEASVRSTQANLIMDKLRNLDGKTVIELKKTLEPEKLCIRTAEPEKVLELLSPYLNPEYILGLEVRNQTLEDVYITIIKGEKE